MELYPGPDSPADPPPSPDPRDPAERPVQARIRNGEYVLRIPGVRVLHRMPFEHGANTDIASIWADQRTGIALLGYILTNPVCSASIPEAIDARLARLPSEVFEQARERAAYIERW